MYSEGRQIKWVVKALNSTSVRYLISCDESNRATARHAFKSSLMAFLSLSWSRNASLHVRIFLYVVDPTKLLPPTSNVRII
jgi:hypothetical protein